MGQRTRKPKDRDFIETKEGLIFCVAGYLHPPDRYTAYLKYSPASVGKWKIGETSYRRELEYYHVNQVAKTIAYLERYYPHYVHRCSVRDIKFSMVPHGYVKQYYCPERRLREILDTPQDPLEEEVNALVSELVAVSGIEMNALGITGSILLKMHSPQFSDVDLLVYGLENAQKIRTALKARKSTRISPVGGRVLEEWCTSVAGHFGLSHGEVRHLADRRWNYGFFEGRFFSIHPTRTDEEIQENYGDTVYKQAGTATIRAVVTETSESLFTPALYRIDQVKILEGEIAAQHAMLLKEVISYEGLYRDVVDNGQAIEAKGKLENVNGRYYRLVVGTTMFRGKEYIRPVSGEEVEE